MRDLVRMVEIELSSLQLATMDALTSMLYFDLGDYKHISDKYGHAEGDRALIAFSNALLEVFRDSNVLG